MRILFISLFVLIVNIGHSQGTSNLKVTKSVPFTDKVVSEAVLSIHTMPSGLTGIVRDSKKNLLFDVFNGSFVRVKNILVPIDKNEDYYGNLSYGDIMKIFTVFSPSKQERVVFCHEFNIVTGLHKKTELFKVEVEKNQSIFSGGNKRETGFAMSPNGHYFVVSTDNIKKHSNSYTIHVFNSETLELLYTQSYQENTEKFYAANDLAIDDDANVYSLGKLFLDGRAQKKNGNANYDFIINKVNNEGIKTAKVDFNKDHQISSLIISLIDNKMRLMGFYSEERAGRIKGALIFDVDKEDLHVSENKLFKLPETVYKDLFSEEKADRKKDDELSSYYIDYILSDSLGNNYLLAEEFFVTTQYVYTGVGGGYSYTVFHYNNVLVLKFNPQGEVEWGRSIFKRATAPSYNAFIKDNELHVILNSGKNLTEKEDGRVKVSKGLLESTALYDIEFSKDGNVMYNKIQDNKGNAFYTPYYGTYNGERFVTIGAEGPKRQFLILE